MKKILFTFGVATSVIAPIAFAISCGEVKTQEKPKTLENHDQHPYKTIDGIKIYHSSDVDTDGIYFTKNSFKNGKLVNPKTGLELDCNSNDFIAMPTNGDYMKKSNVVELGDGDVFYVAFNNDNEDGLSSENFENEFKLMDTSYSSSPEIDSWNVGAKNEVFKTNWGSNSIRVGFNDQKSNPWTGSQSNHTNLTFNQAMEQIKSKVTGEVFESLKNYYEKASQCFVPLFQPQGMFTYVKESKNLYAVTFHNVGTNLTATELLLKKSNNSIIKYDTFSIGAKSEWSAYEAHQETTYFAKKN